MNYCLTTDTHSSRFMVTNGEINGAQKYIKQFFVVFPLIRVAHMHYTYISKFIF